MTARQPLILTLSMDQAAQQYFTTLRHTYFPAWCNFTEAHITLFHNLAAAEPFVVASVDKLSSRPSFPLWISAIENLGKGVAFAIESAQLQELHKEMQAVFSPYLTAKDRKDIWPHLTIQNKVTAYKARLTTEKLLPDFTPFSIRATGFSLWKYNKGPWIHLKDFLFTG